MDESPAFKKMKAEGTPFQGAADRGLRPVEECQDRAPRAARPGRRPGGGLVHGPVLRAVLPDASEGRRLHRQHADRLVAAPRHRRLRALRLAVRQDRPQADHPRRLPARGADLFPGVQADDATTANPALSKAHADGQGRRSSPTRPTARSSSTRPARAKFTSRCDIAKARAGPRLGATTRRRAGAGRHRRRRSRSATR